MAVCTQNYTEMVPTDTAPAGRLILASAAVVLVTVGAALLAVPLSLGVGFPSQTLQTYLTTWALLLSAG